MTLIRAHTNTQCNARWYRIAIIDKIIEIFSLLCTAELHCVCYLCQFYVTWGEFRSRVVCVMWSCGILKIVCMWFNVTQRAAKRSCLNTTTTTTMRIRERGKMQVCIKYLNMILNSIIHLLFAQEWNENILTIFKNSKFKMQKAVKNYVKNF